MSLGPTIPLLAVALITSVTGMVHGAGIGDNSFTSHAAVAFVILIVTTAIVFNAPLWRKAKSTSDVQVQAATMVRRNARLAAAIYGWGAAAMFAVYSLSDLSWRHSWQYGLGMAIIAAGIMIYTEGLKRRTPPVFPPLSLTLFHGGVAAAGLSYLIGSGKLQTIKSDWAANDVFLWGGIGILALCALSAVSQVLHQRT